MAKRSAASSFSRFFQRGRADVGEVQDVENHVAEPIPAGPIPIPYPTHGGTGEVVAFDEADAIFGRRTGVQAPNEVQAPDPEPDPTAGAAAGDDLHTDLDADTVVEADIDDDLVLADLSEGSISEQLTTHAQFPLDNLEIDLDDLDDPDDLDDLDDLDTD